MSVEDIMNKIERFTPEETDRINQLAAGSAENITDEDLKLYSRWQTSVALAQAQYEAERAAAEAEALARIEQARALNDAAVANLEAQRDLALARLEAVKNGQI